MRIRQLQLIRYGRFEDRVLEFPPSGCDLHMILGVNEAGKSTTLAAVGDLLFGFPHRTPFDFQFDRQLLRIGAVIEDNGAAQELRRRKGNADTLMGPDETPIGDAALAPLLAGQSRASFERMFGLDHTRLRVGGQAMLDASNDAGQAIFAAGSGLLNVSRVCDALEDEAKEIWINRAVGGRRYHVAAGAYQEARSRLRDAEIRTYKWAEARRAFEGAEDELEALRRERAEVAQQHRAVERRRRILSSTARRALIAAELEALSAAPNLTANEEARLAAAIAVREAAVADMAVARRDISTLESNLVDAEPRGEALALRDEVEALRESKASIEDGRSARPALEAQLHARGQRLAGLAAEVGWDEGKAVALKAKLPGRPALADLGDLIAKRSGIEEQLRAAREGSAEANVAVARLTADMDAFPVSPDIRPLQEAVQDLRARALPEATQRAATDLAQLEEVLGARLRSLSPWTGDAAALRALHLPADEDIDDAVARIEALEAALREETSVCLRDEEQLQQLDLDRRQQMLAHPAPSLEALVTARRSRGEAWSPLKVQLEGGRVVETPDAAIAAFEKHMTSSDEVADARFAGAEYAGGLAALEREIEKSTLRLAQARSRRVVAETDLAAATTQFEALVSVLVPGLTPKSIHGWRDAVADAVEVANGRDAAARNHQGAAKAEAEACTALNDLLGGNRPEDPLPILFKAAERTVEAAIEARTRLGALQTRLEAAQSAETKASAQVAAAERADADWHAAWAPALRQATLPKETSVSGARARLQLIEDLRAELDLVLHLEAQLVEIDSRSSAYAGRVSAAAVQLGLKGDLATLVVGLQAQVGEAIRLADRSKDLANRLEKAQGALEDATTRLAVAETDLNALLDLEPQADARALRELLRQAGEARRLGEERRKAEAEIVDHGEGRTLEVLIGEVEGADPDGLASEAQALSERMDDLNARVETQSAVRQAAESNFRAIDDGPQAAVAASDMAQASSEMAEQAELYMRKRAEIRLLRAGIERYRKEKQAPLLARASDLFATLTLGGFSGLMVEYEGDAPKLLGVRADGASVTPVDGMSDGTMDQLFLALRVAAIEDVVAQGARLPFLADDLFVNFDDERAAAGFRILGDLAAKTQVLFFTHHPHLVAIARNAVGTRDISVCGLKQSHDQPLAAPVPAA